ncbi:MAG: type II toxin-antitoxin system VapC family toxin, partial [Candidatus Methanodesulfokora sp.]
SNAIWKSFRRGFISEEDAKAKFQAMRKLIDVNVILYNELEVLDKAFEVSIKEGITVYDALYIALSMKLGGKLATLDKRQKSVAENLGIETLVG